MPPHHRRKAKKSRRSNPIQSTGQKAATQAAFLFSMERSGRPRPPSRTNVKNACESGRDARPSKCAGRDVCQLDDLSYDIHSR